MKDVQVAELAARQFNRVSRAQLNALGVSNNAIAHRVAAGRFILVEEAVFALAPLLEHDDWGQWMGATLTAPESVLSHFSAAGAAGFWDLRRPYETITRPGSGGPRRHGGVLVYRSTVLAEDCTSIRGIPCTTVPRTLLDLARLVGHRSLARSVREAVRLELTSLHELFDCVRRHDRRRGTRHLAVVLARYAGLPLERARSGAEVRAMEILRDAHLSLPRLNFRIAREEADLSWPEHRVILEIDGAPFHLDVGEDARKQVTWEGAGWEVRRISSDDVYKRPQRLLALVPR